jgi:hypothetical protein
VGAKKSPGPNEQPQYNILVLIVKYKYKPFVWRELREGTTTGTLADGGQVKSFTLEW